MAHGSRKHRLWTEEEAKGKQAREAEVDRFIGLVGLDEFKIICPMRFQEG